MTKILEIEGIGEKYAAALESAGITTVEALLEAGLTPTGRETIAATAGVTAERVLRWVNRADLMRIHGIGSEYSDLLEVAGIETVKELATAKADTLTAHLESVNRAKHLVRRTPSATDLEKWVSEAKALTEKALSDDASNEQRTALAADPGKVESFELTQAVLDLISEAAAIFGSTDDAIAWLNAPNRSIGGVPPRSLLDKGLAGVQEAKAILFRLEEGIYS